MPRGTEAPEPWATAMKAVGAKDPRTGKASMRMLAELCGVNSTTIIRTIYAERQGPRGPDPVTVKKIADVLKETPATILGWINQERVVTAERWEPPASIYLLDRQSQLVVESVVNELARLQRKS